jgi:Flp pilus assembly protein TadG
MTILIRSWWSRAKRCLSRIGEWGRSHRPLWAAQDGVSTLEFAVVVPVLCILVLGVLDFGMVLWEQMEVSNAARAGAEYAVTANSYSSSTASTAVTSATGLSSITATPAPQGPSYGCPDATRGILSASSTATCPDGSAPGRYVVIYAQASYNTIFTWPGVPDPITLSAQAIARVN